MRVLFARKLNERQELVKFRIGHHKLMIEIGTYAKTLRPENTLPFFIYSKIISDWCSLIVLPFSLLTDSYFILLSCTPCTTEWPEWSLGYADKATCCLYTANKSFHIHSPWSLSLHLFNAGSILYSALTKRLYRPFKS